jgi:hypothetical protein
VCRGVILDSIATLFVLVYRLFLLAYLEAPYFNNPRVPPDPFEDIKCWNFYETRRIVTDRLPVW